MRKSRWMLLAAGFAGLCLLSQEAAGQAKAQKGDAKPVPGLMTKKGGMLHVPSSGPVIQVMNAQKRCSKQGQRGLGRL